MKGQSILGLLDLPYGDLEGLLEVAERFARDGIPAARPGRVVCGLFFNPSLRTRVSLEVASAKLGAHCIVHDVGSAVWRLETRDGAVMDGDAQEHVRDAVGNFLSGAVDLLGVRCFADFSQPWEENRTEPVLGSIARAASVPLVNLESALEHPMQGLADLLTLRQNLEGPPAERTVAITWAYHPRPLPFAVPHTALLGFCRAGYRVRLAHPRGFDLDEGVLAAARQAAGDRLQVVHDMDEGVRGADVIYAKSWGSREEYGAAPDRARRAALRDWIVDRRRQELGAPAAFMHCLPVRRNVVVTDEVIDGPLSWVRRQALNRVLTQAAVLHEVLA